MGEIATINATELAKNIKVNILITGYTKFRIRLAIGSFLIRLGTRVINADGKIEFKE